MSDLVREASLSTMSDEELVDFTCYLYESLKRLDETKKEDEQLKELRRQVTDYEYKNYGYEVKMKKLQLKAARTQLANRGVTFNFKEDLA